MRPGRTVVFVSNRAYGIASSRLEIVNSFVRSGWRVVVAGSRDPTYARLEAAGAEFIELPFVRAAVSPWHDIMSVRRLRTLYSDLQPTLIHHFNTKPIILGGIAAAGVPDAAVVNTVTGRGYALYGGGLTARITRAAFRRILRRAAVTVFQNSDDLAYFTEHRLVTPRRARLVVSSGVETQRYRPVERHGVADQVVVLLAGRLMWQKGIASYAAAAELLRKRHPEVRFCIAGEVERGHPDAVPTSWLDERAAEGVLEYLGHVEDMPQQLAATDIFVLPSTFGEGVPRAVLEAASCGVPVIATDVAGSREVVRDGETGFLVPVNDPEALADRIESLIMDASLRRRFGEAGRSLMVDQFDRAAVLRQMLAVYADAGVELEDRSTHGSRRFA
jgi:glycosyltransferase involved in cell wall biosynthesis